MFEPFKDKEVSFIVHVCVFRSLEILPGVVISYGDTITMDVLALSEWHAEELIYTEKRSVQPDRELYKAVRFMGHRMN